MGGVQGGSQSAAMEGRETHFSQSQRLSFWDASTIISIAF
jgi:hypothetical protein